MPIIEIETAARMKEGQAKVLIRNLASITPSNTKGVMNKVTIEDIIAKGV
jgi:hypothetical protein